MNFWKNAKFWVFVIFPLTFCAHLFSFNSSLENINSLIFVLKTKNEKNTILYINMIKKKEMRVENMTLDNFSLYCMWCHGWYIVNMYYCHE